MTMNDPRDDPKYQVGGDQYKSRYDRTGQGSVDAQTVKSFHDKSDLDSSQGAQHHTLGSKHDQAAAGDHNHRAGLPYKGALDGITITGAKAGNAALASVVAALVQLGATDSTT
jgi:hypothetical protein